MDQAVGGKSGSNGNEQEHAQTSIPDAVAHVHVSKERGYLENNPSMQRTPIVLLPEDWASGILPLRGPEMHLRCFG